MDTGEVVLPETLPLERLEAEITELAAHLAAGECRWLLLVAEYDRREGYEEWGCRSAAQWLSWHCGLDLRSAREKLRVGHALADLPRIREDFAAGRLSYSKVRALTRIATPDNEAELVMLAEHATAVHVERIVRAYRRVWSADEEVAEANQRHADRYLSFEYDEDGCVVVHGRMPAEVGALVMAALDRAVEVVESGPAGPSSVVRSATQVDALELMGESFLAHDPAARKGADRYQVVLNVDADVLSEDAPGGVGEVDGGGELAAETLRRLSCDASTVFVLRGKDGRPLNVSDTVRTVPRALRRAAHARDGGCRFPGCGERRFVDVHHIHHWAHGGQHTLANVIELCWFHHRLVHEGGWQIRFESDGAALAITPEGNVLPRGLSMTSSEVRSIERRNRGAGVTIDAGTAVPHWHGEPLDLDHITTALSCIDRLGYIPAS